jgi:choline-glycine betaine transporter
MRFLAGCRYGAVFWGFAEFRAHYIAKGPSKGQGGLLLGREGLSLALQG